MLNYLYKQYLIVISREKYNNHTSLLHRLRYILRGGGWGGGITVNLVINTGEFSIISLSNVKYGHRKEYC